ncbi:hypothetical protein L873DRAFT_1103817 [Choiromyces venosus 120613-1]|uniref:Uncharacterized protein n=1 Tax=Choiromyces venosus 120613-1 TaxID=1336337 RepID=A0A3N4JHE1_9PEZI|nr:hypothetical protein L873DRAFT_1103817 [Choiromyces venosus 120613-1]
MARRKAVAAVERDEEVRVTRTTRSRAAQAAQQAAPSPPPPPPAPRGRTTTKSTSRKRKSSVSSDEDDELATKKANIRTSSSPAPPVNRGKKAAIKNARGRHDEMDVEGPENVEELPVDETEHETGQNLPMDEDQENVKVEAEAKKPKKTRKAPAKKRGAQKKVAVPDSGIRKGRKPGRKFDGPQVQAQAEVEMSATDDAGDGEASAVTSSMLTEEKTDTPPSSFIVQENSNAATEDTKVQVEEPEKVIEASTRKRGAKKMEVASEPVEPKVETSEETTTTNVEKPKAKRGRKPGQKNTKKGGKKAPAVKPEAEEEEEAPIQGPNIEGGSIHEGSLEETNAEGATADKNTLLGADVREEKDKEVKIEEAPVDQVSVEETITDAVADIQATKVEEARVEEPKADAAMTEEAILEENAVNVAVLDESAVGELTVESTAFDKVPEIPMVEGEAKAEVEVEEAKVLESSVVPAEMKEVVVEESVVEEAALEHVATGDTVVDGAPELEVTQVEEAEMVEKIVEDISVEEAGGKDSDLDAEKTIAENADPEPKAVESEVSEVVEKAIAVQQPSSPDTGDAIEDVVDETTVPTGILAESTNDVTNTATSIAVEPTGDNTIDSITMAQAESNAPEGRIYEDEDGQLIAEGSTKNTKKSSLNLADAAGSDIEAEIKDRRHMFSSLKRKSRLSEPVEGNVADILGIDGIHKRRSTGGGLPLPKRPRVTPPPMQPPSTPATISPSPRKIASPGAETTPRSRGGPLTTPVKPLGPFLMPPATPEAVAGIGRSPTKGSTPLKLVSDDDGTVVITTEGARRRGQEMAQRHLQHYQCVFQKLRADFEAAEGFQQAYQDVMRRAFPPIGPSGSAGLSSSPPALLALEGHGLGDGDDSFDRSFDRSISPDRSSIIWAWDIEHKGIGSQDTEGEDDTADDAGDEASEATGDPLNVEKV